MGLSSDSPQGAVTEARSMTGETRSPHLTDDRQPNVVEVDEEPKRDDTKDVKEQSASLGGYFVCVQVTESIFRRNIPLITPRGFFPT